MARHPRSLSVKNQYCARFARFEHALMQGGFYRLDDRGLVGADWERFARKKEMKEVFRKLSKESFVRGFLEFPPMKLAPKDGTLKWHNVRRLQTSSALCAALQRLRNNLFHGDKGKPFWHDDERWLYEGLHILDRLLEEHGEIRRAYESGVEVA